MLEDRIEIELSLFSHGGTALALRGLKGFTEDVDFSIDDKSQFDYFGDILKRIGYSLMFDFMEHQREHLVRYESEKYTIDRIDLRYPTWNNWTITNGMKRSSLILKFGKIELIVPEIEAIFLFKCYPLRIKDISDIQMIIEKSRNFSLSKVINLIEEQESVVWKGKSTLSGIDPVLTIAGMWTRIYLTLHEVKYRSKNKIVQEIFDFAKERFDRLSIKENERELIGIIHDGKYETLVESKYYDHFKRTLEKEFKKAKQSKGD